MSTGIEDVGVEPVSAVLGAQATIDEGGSQNTVTATTKANGILSGTNDQITLGNTAILQVTGSIDRFTTGSSSSVRKSWWRACS